MKLVKTLILALALVPSLVACGDISDGEKVGTVVRIQKKGIFCPTWEVEMVRGGMNGGSGVAGGAFDFTVEDPAVLDIVKKSMDDQQEIKVGFRTEFATWCRSDSGDVFGLKAEPTVHSNTTIDVQPVQPKPVAAASGQLDPAVVELLHKQSQLIDQLLEKSK